VKIMLFGMESSGKTELVRSLSGRAGESARFRGTTVAYEAYKKGEITYIDSPGIFRDVDAQTYRIAVAHMQSEERILLVIHALYAHEQLPELLSLVTGKKGMVVLTHWDRVSTHPQAAHLLTTLKASLGVPVLAMDARTVSQEIREEIESLMEQTHYFSQDCPSLPSVYPLTHHRSLLTIPVLGPLLAFFILFLPALGAVLTANAFANALNAPLHAVLDPLLRWSSTQPIWIDQLLGGSYGFIAMFPFLLLYALPTVCIFSLLLSLLKTTGLVDRLTIALEKTLHPVGLSGRDLVRVIMGFGCNVPAVINTRACASCSRSATVHAISFGSACSYQLPASLAVFAAAGMPMLAPLFLGWLGISTLIYVRFTTPASYRSAQNTLRLPSMDEVQAPSLRHMWSDMCESMGQFIRLALPVFLIICFIATLMDISGVLTKLSRSCAPLMSLFNLPGEASTAVILGSIRKDGLAIALLDNEWQSLKIVLETPVQVLTAVFLSGVLLPCLVTLWTIGRELGLRYALKLSFRQIVACSLFSLLLAWGGRLFV
jgi:ferrous iron transport protein B